MCFFVFLLVLNVVCTFAHDAAFCVYVCVCVSVLVHMGVMAEVLITWRGRIQTWPQHDEDSWRTYSYSRSSLTS